ncbi:MAG TPA: glucose-6-phosphate isomerase, partial [Casimicrobiaceae bacterium]|nr:glucose-6-phosphate isomerase [Casimicrobiaceae bacterium]
SEALLAQARTLSSASVGELFANDPARASALTFDWGEWRVDVSKERLTATALDALLTHAETIGVRAWIEALFCGERINLSEERPALHTALRQRGDAALRVGGEDVIPKIRATQARMREIAERVRSGAWLGAKGRPIRSVINLGIGGSDLGPRFVCDALQGDASDMDVAFVANVDPEALSRELARRDPATTLFIVTSKTFTTIETLANAKSARDWLARELPREALAPHLIGVTANVAEAERFGVDPDNVLPMWDWVGGRYSLWSAVGLPIAIANGYDVFDRMLEGAAAIDEHVKSTPSDRNLAILLALVAWWNARWMGAPQRLVIPYAHALRRLPDYLQQLVLESNGKRVTRDGSTLQGPSSPSLWGGTGTDAQHSFFQWLHQGTPVVPVEFVVPVRARNPIGEQQQLLVANALAQAQALLVGRSPATIRRELAQSGLTGAALDAAVAARVCPGNRPSTTLLIPQVDAYNVGALIALYEHRTYVESLLHGVNAFDQWGVELGKALARPIAGALVDDELLPHSVDASTQSLVAHARALMQRR